MKGTRKTKYTLPLGLEKKVYLAGMNLAVRNARALLRSASLLKGGSANRLASVLSILAIEEASKVVLLVICSHPDSNSASLKTREMLGTHFRKHSSKLWLLDTYYGSSWKGVLYARKHRRRASEDRTAAQQYRELLESYKDVYSFLKRKRIESLAAFKLRCLYTEILPDGSGFAGPEVVPTSIRSSLLNIAEAHLDDARSLRDSFRRSRTAALPEAIADSMLRDVDLYALAHQLGIDTGHLPA